MQTATQPYLLGHESTEIQRLIAQSEYYRELTRDFLQRAGLEKGMRVLDIGCGPGDVSMLAASIVGPRGQVVGIDRSSEVIEVARRRARAAGMEHTQFLAHDLNTADRDALESVLRAERFDAVIGRFVLMYLKSPSAVVARLASLLKPGGIVAFQEIYAGPLETRPRLQLAEWCAQRLQDAFAHAGLDPAFGLEQPRIFSEAGLPQPQMRIETRVEIGAGSLTWTVFSELIRTLLPVIEACGSARREEVDIDTLEARLRAEAGRVNAVVPGPAMVGAWTRLETAAH